MNRFIKNNKGTTLIELLLYIFIAGFVIVELSGIISEIVYEEIKIEAISREDQNARNVMRLITQSVEEAQTVNSPNFVNASSSTLNITDNQANIIQYTIVSGIIYKQINNGQLVSLSSSDIYVSNILYTVQSEAGVSPSINIKLDIQQSQNNTSTLTHYETTIAQRKL